ncbi:MAG: hypothetical protein K0R57_6409 [Paenibacillaceae bacterium]|nr:hypothetical protein [Paenibacillaceae bacterium]
MSRIRPGRLLVSLFAVGFAIFFGLDLANRGMERVQGPMEEAGRPASVAHQPESGSGAAVKPWPSSSTKQGGTAAASSVKSGAAQQTPVQGKTAAANSPGKTASQTASAPRVEVKESFLNHLCNRIGDALQKTSRALIGVIVDGLNAIIS